VPIHVSIYCITIVVVAAKGAGGGGVEGGGVGRGGRALKHKASSAERIRARRCAMHTYSSYLST